MSDNISDIGYNPKANPYDDFLRSIGMDREFVRMITDYSYNEFIRELRFKLSNQNENEKLTQEDLDVLSSWTEEDFLEFKRQAVEMHKMFDENNKETSEVKEWRPDYRKILNGNFDKLDKSILSDEAKIAFNVQGLPDFMYDIYYDTEAQQAMPIYYDFDTNNEHFFTFTTFLEQYKKIMNIPGMNPNVPLILFDRSLMHVDTDAQLTPVLQTKVALECERNPMFYFRECARVFDKTSGKHVRYQMTIATYTFLWLYMQCINTFNERPRQTGKTFDINYAGGFEFGIGSRNTLSLVVHYKSTEAGKNRRSMVDSINLAPKFLKFHTIKKVKRKGKEVWEDGPDPIPTEKGPNFYNDRFRNNIKITAVGATETTAQQVGRGDSPKFGFVDELNYVKNALVVLTALQFAHGTARILAEKAGERFGLHFSSTAGELNTKDGQAMYKLTQEDMCKFHAKLFGYSYDDLILYLKRHSDKNFFTISYQYDEMGYGEDWIENAISLSTTREKFQQDILSVWQAVDADALFSVAALTRIHQITKETLKVYYMYEKFNKIEFYPKTLDADFKDYIKGINAISIGIDIALGTSGDYSIMKAIDLETAKPVFFYRENTLNAFDFGILIREFTRHLKKLNPDLLIVLNPESDGPGQVIIPMLTKEKDIEPMIYRSLEFYNKQMRNVLIKATTKHLDSSSYLKYGTAMATHRKDLTNVLLFDLVDKYPYVFNNDEAFKELTTLKRKNSGKIEHANGFHDDIIMATLHACAPIFMPKFRAELEKFFKFVVDFRKIESMPLDSHIVSYNEIMNHNNIEGRIDWAILTKVDPITKLEYDELVITKIINGRKVKLTPQEVQEELSSNKKLQSEPRIRTMRLRRFDLMKQRLQEEHVSREMENLDSITFKNTSIEERERKERSKNPFNIDENKTPIRGSDLSYDGKASRSSGYYKKNMYNYKSSLI